METICHKLCNISSKTSVLYANIDTFPEWQYSAGIFQKSLNHGSWRERVRQSDRDRETTASGQESEKQKKEGVENVKKKRREKDRDWGRRKQEQRRGLIGEPLLEYPWVP